MASPMSWFRKNQKFLMAVFGITLIGIFLVSLVLPPGQDFGPARARVEDPVVVRWNEGELHASDLANLRFRHFQAQAFLEALHQYATKKKKSAVIPRTIPIAPIDQTNIERAEQDILSRYLLARQADKQGIVISDATIDEHLALLADDVALTPAEMAAVNRSVNERVEFLQIREQLRMELAAQQMQILISPGAYPMNPTQAAQFYAMNTRLIECEVLPYQVADYLPKVTSEPATADLQALYLKGKSIFPDKFSHEPAFKHPRRVNVQYLSGDLEAFLVNEMNKLTDQQVQEEYDRRVKANDPTVMEEVKPENNPAAGDSSKPAGDSGQPPAENSSEGGNPGEQNPPAGGGSDSSPSDGKSPAAGESPESTSAPPPAGESAPPDSNNPPGEKKDGGLTQTNTKSETASDFTEALATGAAEFVAFRTDSQESPAQEAQESVPPNTPPTTPVPPTGENTEAQQQEPTAPTTDPNQGVPGSETPETTPAKPELRPRPLKDVADQIKRSLKMDAAREALSNAIETAETEVRDFQVLYQDWEAADKKSRGPAPVFDAKSVADRQRLAFGESGLMTFNELAETEIGKVRQFVRGETNFFQETVAMHIAPRFNGLSLYEPFAFRDVIDVVENTLKTTSHVFWLIDKKDAKIPTFEEARGDLEKYWKREQAVQMALKDAQAAAQDATTSGKKLSEMFGEKASLTGQFPWYSSGMGSFGYSEIPGVTHPGEDFMKAAFGLKPGQATAAVNDTHDQVYVIRMVSDDSRSTADLMKQFAEALTPQKPYPQGVVATARDYQGRVNEEWVRRFFDSLGLEWVNR